MGTGFDLNKSALVLCIVVIITVGAQVKIAPGSGEVKLYCVDLLPTPFCDDARNGRTTMPKKVCAKTNTPVTVAKSWNAEVFSGMADATCPTNPALFTKQQFCQTNFIPCTNELLCPTTTKLCYSLCLNGGQVAAGKGHTFLPPASCQNITATAFCEARRERGEVASLEETAEGKCVGLSYYNLYYTMGMVAQTPFQPRACRASFPLHNVEMVEMNDITKVNFMKSLAKKLNRIWDYTNNDKPHKWHRPVNIRLRRVQKLKGVVQVFTELKEFCLTTLRKGRPDWSLRYNEDLYCDDISVSPETVYANLTKLLDSKREDRGMLIGEFNIKKQDDPGLPTHCYTWQPEVVETIPGWVWALSGVGGMCCLLSTLILQHMFRNRASYVRAHEKLRSYA